jgi:CBS domain-containing protein
MAMNLNQTALEAKRLGVFTCERCQDLGDAARTMADEDISALVITDEEGFLRGILSRTDLLRAAVTREDWRTQPIAQFMSQEVVTVPPTATLRDVAEILLDHRIHRVVVTRQEKGRLRPVSVISAADIVYHMAKTS